jgi:hypothetical protein
MRFDSVGQAGRRSFAPLNQTSTQQSKTADPRIFFYNIVVVSGLWLLLIRKGIADNDRLYHYCTISFSSSTPGMDMMYYDVVPQVAHP